MEFDFFFVKYEIPFLLSLSYNIKTVLYFFLLLTLNKNQRILVSYNFDSYPIPISISIVPLM